MADFTPINTQEELDRVIGDRIKRERETVSKGLQAQLTERDEKIAGYESRISGFEKQVADLNTKLEGYNGQAAKIKEMEDKIKGYETSSVKMRIARETGLPMELAERLSGDDEAAIRTDAESLRKALRLQEHAPLFHPTDGAGANDTALKNLLKSVRNKE
jgi:hypothetical protein